MGLMGFMRSEGHGKVTRLPLRPLPVFPERTGGGPQSHTRSDCIRIRQIFSQPGKMATNATAPQASASRLRKTLLP
jgi:hypothetical protein